jgi:hypothetical protein
MYTSSRRARADALAFRATSCEVPGRSHLNCTTIELILNRTLEDVCYDCDVMPMARRGSSWREFNCRHAEGRESCLLAKSLGVNPCVSEHRLAIIGRTRKP